MANIDSINSQSDDFFQRVFEIARLIPEGRVTSYGAIAKALGTPKSSRMVGWAMSRSSTQAKPVPAHRVVNRIGVLTGKHHFVPPESMQEALESEGIKVENDKIVDFEKYFWDPIEELGWEED